MLDLCAPAVTQLSLSSRVQFMETDWHAAVMPARPHQVHRYYIESISYVMPKPRQGPIADPYDVMVILEDYDDPFERLV